jgi:hypothetical protein
MASQSLQLSQTDSSKGRSLFWFAAKILLGAFLVFQVQPVISKCVLPWFGGTPAVWTTCMLFFQVLLFGGYAYAHLLRTLFQPRQQALIHLILLCAAALMLPIEPSAAWKPTGSESPTLYLLWMLAAHVGLPYFVLSSTGPLVQAWLSYQDDSDRVYRLYALSNAGSLVALLSYPFLVEPFLSVSYQSSVWSLMFCAFVIVQAVVAVSLFRVAPTPRPTAIVECRDDSNEDVSWGLRAAWVGLPALASTMLLVVTNHICQDVAVIPFLWVLPLSLYLVSFIVCFDSPQWYKPRWIAVVTLAAVLGTQATSVLPGSFHLVADVISYMATLLGVCLLAHGEVARIKPRAAYLTQYYMLLSAGGAIGGLVVAVACPTLLNTHFELPVMMSLVTALSFVMLFVCRGWSKTEYDWAAASRLKFSATAMAIIPLIALTLAPQEEVITSERNFFGVLKVERHELGVRLVHGSTIHGMQLSGDRSAQPTTYYSEPSGVGRTFTALQHARPTLHVGVVGLGCGVLATYGRDSDRFDMIEINPAVIDIAQSHFSFLSDSRAKIQNHLGDGRLVLERMTDTKFDLLVLDAFSSDAIPAHLLTRESMSLYKERIKSDGVLAVHISNNHLDLAPLVHRLCADANLKSLLIRSNSDKNIGAEDALWVVVADPGHDLWSNQLMSDGVGPTAEDLKNGPLWTDQHHNLVSVLRLW